MHDEMKIFVIFMDSEIEKLKIDCFLIKVEAKEGGNTYEKSKAF